MAVNTPSVPDAESSSSLGSEVDGKGRLSGQTWLLAVQASGYETEVACVEVDCVEFACVEVAESDGADAGISAIFGASALTSARISSPPVLESAAALTATAKGECDSDEKVVSLCGMGLEGHGMLAGERTGCGADGKAGRSKMGLQGRPCMLNER